MKMRKERRSTKSERQMRKEPRSRKIEQPRKSMMRRSFLPTRRKKKLSILSRQGQSGKERRRCWWKKEWMKTSWRGRLQSRWHDAS